MAENDAVERTLEEIGLTSNEARVYVALTGLGSATAYQIAARCEVKKPTVYVTLEELRKKGLVLKVPHAKKALFSARNIEEYLRERREKLLAVESLIPKLQELRGDGHGGVYFFSGMRGLDEAIGYKVESMRGKRFSSLYGNLEGCGPEVMRLYASWDKKALARDVSFRVLMQEKDSDTYYKDTIALALAEPESLEIRFLKDYTFPGNTSLEIGEDFVRIIDAKNLHATVIDDKSTADMFRQMFEIAWTKGV